MVIVLAVIEHVGAVNCEVPADPDLLGIGVRLGFYFQFATNFLLIFTRPEEAASSIILSSMMMSGYFIATIYSITHNNLAPGVIIPTTWFFVLDVSASGVISAVTRAGSDGSGFMNWMFRITRNAWSPEYGCSQIVGHMAVCVSGSEF